MMIVEVDRYFVPHLDEVVEVEVIENGDGGRNLRRPMEHPVVVRELVGSSVGDEYVVPETRLYRDALAAAIRSEQMDREAMEDDLIFVWLT